MKRMVALRWAVVLGLVLAARAIGGEAPAILAGALHTVAYTTLLVVFGASLRRRHTAVVTRIAQRVNPYFHTGMLRYTRRVTWAWCAVFAGELAISAALLLWLPQDWLGFVAVGHLLPVGLLFLGEYALRRHLFGRDGGDLATMLRAFRSGTQKS